MACIFYEVACVFSHSIFDAFLILKNIRKVKTCLLFLIIFAFGKTT